MHLPTQFICWWRSNQRPFGFQTGTLPVELYSLPKNTFSKKDLVPSNLEPDHSNKSQLSIAFLSPRKVNSSLGPKCPGGGWGGGVCYISMLDFSVISHLVCAWPHSRFGMKAGRNLHKVMGHRIFLWLDIFYTCEMVDLCNIGSMYVAYSLTATAD